jgi:hypothetical protein
MEIDSQDSDAADMKRLIEYNSDEEEEEQDKDNED